MDKKYLTLVILDSEGRAVDYYQPDEWKRAESTLKRLNDHAAFGPYVLVAYKLRQNETVAEMRARTHKEFMKVPSLDGCRVQAN